jgi:hypothetical protein
MTDNTHSPTRASLTTISFVAAPALMAAYGVVRLVDGLDGSHGPGLAWTVGHGMFLLAMLLFGVVVVGLRRQVPATTPARRLVSRAATALGLAGVVAFVRVIVLDLVVGFRAADHAEMSRLSDEVEHYPGLLPGAVYEAAYELGPLLFLVGLLTLVVQLAVLHPRRLPPWAPILLVLGFAVIVVDLNLLPLGGALLGLALAPLARAAHARTGTSSRDATTV